MKKVEPKLTFQVGEKVVITASDREYNYSGGYYPDRYHFTFTTIKEVLEDGSVITAEGYKYRQSFKTEFGELDIHDYFRIDRAPQRTIVKNEAYWFWSHEYYLEEQFDATGGWPTFLFKCTEEWEKKAAEYKEKALAYRREKEEQEAINAKIEAAKKPFEDAYEAAIADYVKKLENAKVKAFRKYMCGNCIHNKNGHCTEWNQKIATSKTTMCTAFEVDYDQFRKT